jgi:hypothetical protein
VDFTVSSEMQAIPGVHPYRAEHKMELVQGHERTSTTISWDVARLAKKDWKEFSGYQNEVNDHITDSISCWRRSSTSGGLRTSCRKRVLGSRRHTVKEIL